MTSLKASFQPTKEILKQKLHKERVTLLANNDMKYLEKNTLAIAAKAENAASLTSGVPSFKHYIK